MYSIHALIDVRYNAVRYVGRTRNTFARLGQHLLDEGKPTLKGAWLSELKQLGLYPKLEILETISAMEDAENVACQRERYWIQKLRSEGAVLLNLLNNKSADDLAGMAFSSKRPVLSPEKLFSLRQDLGWTQLELARQAHLNPNTVHKAQNGEPVSELTAKAIASAFSDAFGKPILVSDIEALNVSS